VRAYLGIDCGSVSVKAVLLVDGQVCGRAYVRNRGLISTLKEVIRQLPRVEVDGAGITGSGKEVAKTIVGGDYIDSEIMSHVVACQRQYPDVRTILDIGGEDSKLMIIQDGLLADFRMNQICGAGTGAMIEAIATRLGIKIEDVGDIALESSNPASLSAKCGIFAQSAVVSELNKGRTVSDILLGVCQALVGNYLLLARGRKLEKPIVFQGATAQNKALVKCFQERFREPVLVPDDCAYMGAIGIAELVRRNMNGQKTNFRGIDILVNSQFATKTSYCDGCENKCELLAIYQDGRLIGRTGSRCSKKEGREEG